VRNYSYFADYFHDGENIIAAEVHAGNAKNVTVAFDASIVGNGKTYFLRNGSTWHYYDAGDTPGAQVANKPTGVVMRSNELPRALTLYPNFPNPFNPSTTISYALPNALHVTLKIYNLLGQEVRTLVNETKAAGMYSVTFKASHLASGVYLCRLQAGNSVRTNKLLLMK
jgi:hypothetical protein